jgi:hypothetical protein
VRGHHRPGPGGGGAALRGGGQHEVLYCVRQMCLLCQCARLYALRRLLYYECAHEHVHHDSRCDRYTAMLVLLCYFCVVLRMIFPKLSKLHAAQVCAKETSSCPVLACLREVSKGVSASSPSAYLATPESVVAVCSVAAGPSSAGGGGGGSAEGSKARSSGRGHSNAVASNVVRPGACLAKLASISSSKLIFDATVPPHLCAQADPTAVLTCLESLHKRMVSVDDVTACINTKQEVKSMRVKRILTEDNGIEIVAGAILLSLVLISWVSVVCFLTIPEHFVMFPHLFSRSREFVSHLFK